MLMPLVDRGTVWLALTVCVMIERLLVGGLCATTSSESCDEFHKECHCGSIATPPYTSLFSKIAYPNTTKKVIEEYDDDIPYGYKYLRVYYRCTNEKDVLVGNNMRECSKGNWGGQVPRCAVNTLNKTKLKIIKINDYRMNQIEERNSTDTYPEENKSKPFNIFVIYYDDSIKLDPNGTFEVPLAKQPNQCLRWSLSPRQIWNLHLAKQTRVHYVRIKLYGDHIEDLYLKHEISIEMALKNISHYETENQSSVDLPIEIKCRETTPKASQFETYQQKYSANYLVLDFLCEIENRERSVFEFMFANDYEVDQLNSGLIEISFQMLNIAQHQSKEGTEMVFQPKISVISLCELKLYSFSNNCGEPDFPVTAIVQGDFTYFGRKSIKYSCHKNYEIIGKPSVECGQYGKWMSEFPMCVPSRPCDLLDNLTVKSGYQIDLEYETKVKAKYGKLVVPNGKYAKIFCLPLNTTSFKEESERNASNSIEPYVWRKGVMNVICRNGQWTGFESTGPTCINQPQNKEKIVSSSSVNQPSQVNHNLNSSSQVISLPLRAIKILFALFVILCLIIVALLIYMVIFRQKMSRVNSLKEQCMSVPIDLCHNNYMVPTIVYNGNEPESEYSGAIYSSAADFYERISLGQSESHLYHTIKGSTNYSDLSLYSKNSELNLEIDRGEERMNSIYGMADEPDETYHNATATATAAESDSANRARLSEKDYNQLSRSSSGYLKKNSIYET